ncbi:hypothetical protein PIB30_067458 [Stylosanthes scabra]|uniref:Uncharacterized protein n=1 Tax=Stylosanthes scabra TaxID=79078 RepID=A0ABU6QPP0_9FABA|nr:hypothetical protein [Stylosanthes scabra]
MPAPGPVYPIPRTPMMDARRYRSLFPRRRVAPLTPPSHPPPPSDDEPSEGTVDPEAELEGVPEDPYLEGYAYPAGYDVYSSDASHGSEQESASASAGSAPSSRHSSDDSSGSGSIGYGEASSGSASDCVSDDDLACKFWNFRVRNFSDIFGRRRDHDIPKVRVLQFLVSEWFILIKPGGGLTMQQGSENRTGYRTA